MTRPARPRPRPDGPPPARPGPGRARSTWSRAPRAWLLAGLAVTAFSLVPLLYVVTSTVVIGPAGAARLLVRGRVAELLGNTTALVVLGCLVSATIGTGAAWLTERTTLPGRRWWTGLMAAPLAVPAFVNSYGWVSVVPAAHGLGGAVVITTLSYYPLVYLPVAAVLRGLDPAFEEVARSLGHGPWRTFSRVVLPQLRPAMLGGTLLVGLHLLAEYGALEALRFPTFTTAIYDEFESTFIGPSATMLAGVLVLACLLLLCGELRATGRARLARVGRGAARDMVVHPLGRLTPVAIWGMAALVACALGVPLGSLVWWLVAGSSTAFPWATLAATTATSIGLGLAGAALTCVLALPVAWLAVRHPSRLVTLVERGTYVAGSLPGVVVALSLVAVSLAVLPPLYQTVPLLVAAYAVLFLPRAVVSLRAALAQVPPELDEVARSLGLVPAEVVRRVILPLIVKGLGAGAALVFLAVSTELTATLLLAPTGTVTLATQFWAHTYDLAYGAAAPYALLMILISVPAAALLAGRAGQGGPA